MARRSTASAPSATVPLALPSSNQSAYGGGLTITGSVTASRSHIDLSIPLLQQERLQEQVVLSPPVEGDGIPAEALRRVLKVLTAHFGAVAGDVLKHVAGRARTIPELHKLLLEQAGDRVDKKTLAKQLKAIVKLPL
ncbi:MAG: hypothetical protein ABW032_00530, partial [Burkholderiaceae bacterium]